MDRHGLVNADRSEHLVREGESVLVVVCLCKSNLNYAPVKLVASLRLDPHIILLKRKKGSHFLVIFTNCQMKFVCLCSVFFENCVQFSKNIFYKPLEQKRRKFNATAFKSHRIEHTDLIIKKY
ncbi:hypothetical protein T09_1529 [Trichinella sp. T9]|nr:hypothetical protein T09_1529 [Trichinella sp. T9]